MKVRRTIATAGGHTIVDSVGSYFYYEAGSAAITCEINGKRYEFLPGQGTDGTVIGEEFETVRIESTTAQSIELQISRERFVDNRSKATIVDQTPPSVFTCPDWTTAVGAGETYSIAANTDRRAVTIFNGSPAGNQYVVRAAGDTGYKGLPLLPNTAVTIETTAALDVLTVAAGDVVGHVELEV